MRKLLALLIVLMMMGFSSICHAHEDMQDWAKELLHNWTEGFAGGCEAATGGLASLDADQLKKLRAMLEQDMQSGEGKIVRPQYGPAGRYAARMIYTIDDLLGQLSYDRMVRGELVESDELGLQVTFYDIKAENGEIIKSVRVGDHTIMPDCDFLEEKGVPYELYLKKDAVIKIGLIKPD